FQCKSCGEFTECAECCIKRHKCMSLHRLSHWNGQFWEDTSLEKMGLMFQLGHCGSECPVPDLLQPLTVLHINGVHTMNARWCGYDVSDGENCWWQLMHNGWYLATMVELRSCATFESLEMFQLLNMVANVNVCDYVSSLEQKMDPWETEWLPDRYKAFRRMSCQWTYLKQMKRAGVENL
ncbi:hypothetical protein ARMGADRAFT_933221, partial [Armillaria gallica]